MNVIKNMVGKKGIEYLNILNQFVKLYRHRLLKAAEIHKMDRDIPQVGTGLFLKANDMIERLYSLIGSIDT